MTLYKQRVKLLDALRKPVAPGYAPLCATCLRYLDSYELVEGYPGQTTIAKVLGRHHGSEEVVTFDMGSSNWDETDLARHMRGHLWLKPNLVSK